MATAGSNPAAGLYKGAHQAKQPIHKAVLDGDDCKVIEATKWCCFTLHAVVEARDAATGATPILLSAERGDDGIARILLDRGASVHAVDNHQQNALHLAAMNGHSKYLELMLAHGGDMEAKTRSGMTPLLLAIEKGQAEAAFFLLERGANLKVKSLPEHGAYTPFLLAVKLKQDAMVDAILKRGIRVDEDRDEAGRTGLFIAVQDDYRPLVDRLLAEGADVDVKDHQETTPLLYVVQQGSRELLELLLEHRANLRVRVRGSGHTPLMLTAMRGDREMLELLLQHGVDVNERDEASYTALMHAAAQGHKEIVALLLHKGAAIVFTQSVKRSSSFGEQSRTVSIATGPSAADVAATEEIREMIKAAENCGPPVLPKQPEVRKEKLEPRTPSILVHFGPPVPTATCPRVTNLKYHAHAFVIRSREELLAMQQEREREQEAEGGPEEGHEECKGGERGMRRAASATDVDEPVATIEGLNQSQSPFVFRGLERGRAYYFKVTAESASGRGIAAYTEPILLATAPNNPPSIEAAAPATCEDEPSLPADDAETGAVKLTIAAPSDDGGCGVAAYVIKARPGSWQVEAEVLAGEDKVDVIFPGLPRGRHYKFTAQARNALGISQASTSVDFTLE